MWLSYFYCMGLLICLVGLLEIVQQYREATAAEWADIRPDRLKITAVLVLGVVLTGWGAVSDALVILWQ